MASAHTLVARWKRAARTEPCFLVHCTWHLVFLAAFLENGGQGAGHWTHFLLTALARLASPRGSRLSSPHKAGGRGNERR